MPTVPAPAPKKAPAAPAPAAGQAQPPKHHSHIGMWVLIMIFVLATISVTALALMLFGEKTDVEGSVAELEGSVTSLQADLSSAQNDLSTAQEALTLAQEELEQMTSAVSGGLSTSTLKMGFESFSFSYPGGWHVNTDPFYSDVANSTRTVVSDTAIEMIEGEQFFPVIVVTGEKDVYLAGMTPEEKLAQRYPAEVTETSWEMVEDGLYRIYGTDAVGGYPFEEYLYIGEFYYVQAMVFDLGVVDEATRGMITDSFEFERAQ